MHTRISKIVRQSGLTKTDFAKRLNVSQPFVSKICAGDSIPSDRTIQDICREFGCNEVWLRTGEGEPFRQQTKEEQIMRSAVRTVQGSDGFRKSLAWMLSQLDEEDWANLEKIYLKQIERLKNKTE